MNEIWDLISSSGKHEWHECELPKGNDGDWIMVNYHLDENNIDYCPAVCRYGKWFFLGKQSVIEDTVIKWRHMDGSKD